MLDKYEAASIDKNFQYLLKQITLIKRRLRELEAVKAKDETQEEKREDKG